MTIAIHRLHLASVWVEDDRIEVYGYLVLTPGHVVLVDTGVGDDSPMIDRLFRPQCASMADLLAGHGVQAGDVSSVVNSHLHYDHCGNNRLFPNADIMVQRAEVAAARQPNYTVPAWFDYDRARLIEIDGDADICPGVRAIASPGHTPGHQSVLVGDGAKPTLIAAQATYSAAEYEAGGDTGQAFEDLETIYLETIAHLRSLNMRRVFFSHDHRSAMPA